MKQVLTTVQRDLTVVIVGRDVPNVCTVWRIILDNGNRECAVLQAVGVSILSVSDAVVTTTETHLPTTALNTG